MIVSGPKPWEGSNITEDKKILILGESHYEEDVTTAGKEVPYTTEGVVQAYLQHQLPGNNRERWDQFFDKIAKSFGYDKDHASVFFNKVWFMNYIPVLCGVGEENCADSLIQRNGNRTDYNDRLFDFVNSKEIDVIVCFSKKVFWNLPAKVNNDSWSEEVIGIIGGKRNLLNIYTYNSGIKHGECTIELYKPLKVYGVRHPSSRGGYIPEDVYKAFSKYDDLKYIIQ